MTDFKAKTHQIRFRLGLGPIPRCLSVSQSLYTFYTFYISLQRSPRPPSWILGPLRGRGWGKRRERGRGGREGEVEGREREGPNLNQGPSEPCYANEHLVSLARSLLIIYGNMLTKRHV